MSFQADYDGLVSRGVIAKDPAQAGVVSAFAALAQRLAEARRAHGFLGRLLKRQPLTPRGLYVYGDVGRGKTMLMDLFFANIRGWSKKRVHFHAFMQEVHKARALQKSIEQIAEDIADEAKLLCLDEMQIVDIADAMIIGRLFGALHERGVVLVTTSNVPPDGLYKDGLNRQLFLPFIAKLTECLEVVHLDSPKDYRLGRVKERETFLHPATAGNRVAFNQLWHDLTDGASGHSETLDVLGRKLLVPKVAHACAAFTFAELCGAALGPADYLAIAQTYRTVFVSAVPMLKPQQRNEVKRLILMIDTFYDAKLRLVILADAPPEKIFPKGQHGFESQRSISRLREMQSKSWWESP